MGGEAGYSWKIYVVLHFLQQITNKGGAVVGSDCYWFLID